MKKPDKIEFHLLKPYAHGHCQNIFEYKLIDSNMWKHVSFGYISIVYIFHCVSIGGQGRQLIHVPVSNLNFKVWNQIKIFWNKWVSCHWRRVRCSLHVLQVSLNSIVSHMKFNLQDVKFVCWICTAIFWRENLNKSKKSS